MPFLHHLFTLQNIIYLCVFVLKEKSALITLVPKLLFFKVFFRGYKEKALNPVFSYYPAEMLHLFAISPNGLIFFSTKTIA